ncbi:MAG: hypothetical protein JEZ14_07565 [Marinilabiliaceae bacterium]|nr:hypothetical protein [Marinilabiliaceae bacterium]
MPTDDSKFLKLTANKNLKEDIYFKALKYAIEDKDIHNIAITGPYGSGKSSVLDSFFKSVEDKDSPVRISLAHFCTNGNTTKYKHEEKNQNHNSNNPDNLEAKSDKEDLSDSIRSTNNKEETEQEVERNIIQQIFYQLPREQTIYSKIRRVRNLKSEKREEYTVFLLVTVLCILWSPILFSSLKENIEFLKSNSLLMFFKNIAWASPIQYINIPVFIFLVYTLYQGLYYAVYYSRKGSIKKLKINSHEIELNQNQTESVLTSNTDELIYLFEASKKKVVIIEDLDRFENINLFTKLRELNILLNQSPEIKESGSINFIFAVRDDLFPDSHQRTKFFDFIIPIVPYVNSNNSRDKLLDLMAGAGFDKENFPISEKFIRNIGYYIYDMRLLANVVNEFKIYIDKINISSSENRQINISHNPEQVFSMILYKNLFPEDFNKLHQKEGLLWDIFNTKKQKLIRLHASEIDEKIESIKKSIDNLSIEKFDSIKILQQEYIVEVLIRTYRNEIKHFTINNSKNISISEINKDDNFEILVNTGMQFRGSYNDTYSVDFKSIENSIDPTNTYEQRKAKITQKQEGAISSFNQEIAQLKKSKERHNKLHIKDLISITTDNKWIDTLLQKNKKQTHNGHNYDLLIYVIRHGYIDENYYHNISIFHEGSLNKQDYEFVMNVKNWKSQPFDIPLTNIENIIEEIDDKEFINDAALNFTLLSHLLSSTGNTMKLDLLMRQFSLNTLKADDFIDQYVDHLQQEKAFDTCNKFINTLLLWHPNFWSFVENVSAKLNAKRYYIQLLLNNPQLQIDDLEKISNNSGYAFKEYIEQESDFLFMFENKTQGCELAELIAVLDIKFEKLILTSHHELATFICENNFYGINPHMLHLMLSEDKSGTKNLKDDLKTQNYSSILQSNNKNIITYINANLNTYYENVWSTFDSPQKESPEAFLAILNGDMHFEYKLTLINSIDSKITFLRKITDEDLLIPLIKHGKVEANWQNIASYYNHTEELNQELVDFLNKKANYEALSESSMAGEIVSEAQVLTELIIKTTEIKEESLKALLKHNTITISSFDIENMTQERAQIILENKALDFNVNNQKLLKEYGLDHHIQFIVLNTDTFLREDINEFKMDANDICLLLNQSLPLDKKEEIIDDLEFNMHDISPINKELWPLLFQYSKVYPSWSNVWLYYEHLEFKLNDTLTDFLENADSIKQLSKQKASDCNDSNKETELAKVILFSNKLSISTIDILAKSFTLEFPTFNKDTVSTELAEILVVHSLLELNAQNYTTLKTYNNDLHILFLSYEILEFFDNKVQLPITDSDYAVLLESNLDKKHKIQLIEEINIVALDISNTHLIEKLVEYIIENEIRTRDFEFIHSVLNLDFNVQEKVVILNSSIKHFTKKQIMSLLNVLPGDFPLISKEKGLHAKIKHTNENKEFASLLEKQQFISSHKIEGDIIRLITKKTKQIME